MGCNQTKQEDIKNSQESERRREEPSQPSSVSIAASPRKGEGEEDPLEKKMGTSYSDKREIEDANYFKLIVEKTAQNFIDVSQNALPLEGNDKVERVSDYKSHMKNVKPSTGNAEMIFGAPIVSNGNINVNDILAAHTITGAEIQLLTKTAEGIESALSKLTVKDCGDLVVSFPEIEFDDE